MESSRLASTADAPVLGSLLVLSCGHNAPWLRRERDAYIEWLRRHVDI